MEYYAHFDKHMGIKQLLHDHLNLVADEIRERITPEVKFPGIPNEILKSVGYWMGYLHDYGKYTDFFQKYLLNGESSDCKAHAHISACFLYNFLANKGIMEHLDKNDKLGVLFLAYFSVRMHHRSLTLAGLFDGLSQVKNILNKQSDHLKHKALEILKDIKLGNEFTMKEYADCCEVNKLLDDKFFTLMPQLLGGGRLRHEKWYFLLIFLFSLLIDADKLNSAGIKFLNKKRISPDEVLEFIKRKHESQKNVDINSKRERARQTIVGRIAGLTTEELISTRFFTITAPTGIGKTLASLQAALLLQERIEKIFGYTSRIITAIPFINIIEQTRKDYEEILKDKAKLIVNHRLADLTDTNARDSEEVIPIELSLLEVEAWEGDIILTTFVQLFHSIFTGKNRALKKINKLAGSIVILDEVQSLPEKYMPLVAAVMSKIVQYFGTRFILMTATQPRLLDLGNLLISQTSKDSFEKIKSVELLPDHESYFKNMKRTKFVSMLNTKLDTQQFTTLFLEKWKHNKSALIVVNTIKRSIEIFKKLKELCGESKYNVPILYLSTNIIPKKRNEVIMQARELLKKNSPIIMVSTQTIEAGVDLDFDMAFRDIAPIESLVQTAGRVNREGKKGNFLPVYIVEMEKDSQYVYKLHNLERTRKILEESPILYEPEYRRVIEEYYSRILAEGIPDESRKLWTQGIIDLDFEKLKEFELIEKRGEIVDVLVECDEYVSKLADAYEHVLKSKDKLDVELLADVIPKMDFKEYKGKLSPFTRKAILKMILIQMSNYIIQIRVSKLKNNLPLKFSNRNGVESTLFWISPDQLERYYDVETGFIDMTGEAFII